MGDTEQLEFIFESLNLSTTEQTRLEAYFEVLEDIDRRRREVFEGLQRYNRSTANELAMSLYEEGLFTHFERNHVHPRLNELVKLGLVVVTGKRKCTVRQKTCSIYEIVKPEEYKTPDERKQEVTK